MNVIHDSTLQDLLNRPDLPVIVQQLNEMLASEREARNQFQLEISAREKAEFIHGNVIMHSPAKAKHLRATQNLVEMLRSHVRRNGLGEVFTEKALISLTRNDYEPDILFFQKARAAAFTEDQMKFPAPDFIVEVLSETTESRDRGVKFNDYAAHGVGEYWIVDCDDQFVEQYVLDANQNYHLLQKVSQSSITSQVVTGFTIPVAAIFHGDALTKFLTAI